MVKFCCPVCAVPGLTFNTLAVHYAWKHLDLPEGTLVWPCPNEFCDLTFTDRDEAMFHLFKYCHSCFNIYKDIRHHVHCKGPKELRVRPPRVKDRMKFHCGFCDLSYVRKDAIIRHMDRCPKKDCKRETESARVETEEETSDDQNTDDQIVMADNNLYLLRDIAVVPESEERQNVNRHVDKYPQKHCKKETVSARVETKPILDAPRILNCVPKKEPSPPPPRRRLNPVQYLINTAPNIFPEEKEDLTEHQKTDDRIVMDDNNLCLPKNAELHPIILFAPESEEQQDANLISPRPSNQGPPIVRGRARRKEPHQVREMENSVPPVPKPKPINPAPWNAKERRALYNRQYWQKYRSRKRNKNGTRSKGKKKILIPINST